MTTQSMVINGREMTFASGQSILEVARANQAISFGYRGAAGKIVAAGDRTLAKPNWWVFRQIAGRMGHQWSSSSAREIWDDEISVLAPQLCGIKYHRMDGDDLQWPCPTEEHSGTCFLHKDGQFTCGLGVFNPVDWTPPAEVPDNEYPLVPGTGRRLAHYHTRTQTGRCEGLNVILGEETADISPEDAHALAIRDGETIQVSSRRGKVQVKAKITRQVPKGLVWMAFPLELTIRGRLLIQLFNP